MDTAVTLSDTPPAPRSVLRADSVVDPDSLERALLEAATPGPARAEDRLRHVPMLGRRGELTDDVRIPALCADANATAVPHRAVERIDAEAVAGWLTDRYTQPTHPAVLLGSPHGSAVHLAAALGAAWLPTSFVVRVSWPGGSPENWPGAAAWGAALAARILAVNPGITVRQVHDPVRDGPLCGATVTLHLRWRRLPAAYIRFLRTRLAPGGVSLVLRDLRTWPVGHAGPGHFVQIGSPVTGLSPDDYDTGGRAVAAIERWRPPRLDGIPQYAERSGEPALETELRHLAGCVGHHAHRALYASPGALSAFVADLYREHLRTVAGLGQSCLVETGRLLAPHRALEHGLVPYWCESAAQPTVDAAEWWLAGSEPFERISALPDPPGTTAGAYAGLAQWRSLVNFARYVGSVDRLAAGRYPRLPLPRSSVVRLIRQGSQLPSPIPAMTVDQVIGSLRLRAAGLGIFFT